MKDYKVRIGTVLTPRDELDSTITLEEFFNAIRDGRWKPFVDKARELRGTSRYDRYRLKHVPGVWLHELPIMCFDWEKSEVTIPAKHILAEFKSIGGLGRAVVIKLPDGLRPDEWRDARKKIQSAWGVVSNERQIANDRPRYISYDPSIRINWNAKPVKIDGLETVGTAPIRRLPSEAPRLYELAKAGNIALDNDTALAVFSWLRNSAYSFEESCRMLEELPFDSRSLRTPRARAKYYEKWERQYGEEFPSAKVVIKSSLLKQNEEEENVVVADYDFEEDDDNTITDHEQIKLTISSVLSPFLPIDITYFGKTIPTTLATVFVGSPSSGKGYINTVVEALDDLVEPIEDELYQWRVDYYTGIVKIGDKEIQTPIDEKKVHKLMPNLSLKWGFQGTDAALLGALSEIPAVLIYTTDFASAMAAIGKDYNSGLVSTLLQLTEGEIIDKINKRQEIHGKTKFKLKNYRAGMIVGGTPDDVIKIFSKNINNGLVSRILFAKLRDSNEDKKLLMKAPKLEKHITSEMILKGIIGEIPRIQASYDEQWIETLKIELMEEYEDPMRHCIRRGVRDSIKRAAIAAWLDGERKSFKLAKKDIEVQLEYFYRSLKFIEGFQDHETDRWGNSMLSQKIKEGKDVASGKALLVSQGIKISDKDAKIVIDAYEKMKQNAAKTARLFGISRQSLYRILKRVRPKE